MAGLTKKQLEWKRTHLKNLIWSANKKESLFTKKDIPGFKRKLKVVNEKLKEIKRRKR